MKKNILLLLATILSFSGFSRTTKGKEFWIAFMENISLSVNGQPVFRLHLSSDVNTLCTISIPYTGYTSTLALTAGQVKTFALPTSNFHPMGDEAIANNGIRLIANDSIEVKAFHYRAFFTESSLILPLHEIGTDYLVTAEQGALGNSPSELVVLATQNNTSVEIVPSVVTAGLRPVGVPFSVVLQAGQIYQLQAFSDLSGTSVVSLGGSKKIAIFSGARQAQNGCNFSAAPALGADNHIYDQMYPTFSFGNKYHVIPFQTHLFDFVKVVASQNNTSISVTNGNNFTLNKGQVATFTVNTSCEITSNLPVSVAQLSSSQDCNYTVLPSPIISGTLTGDPGMINLVPAELTLKKALFYTEGKPVPGNVRIYFRKHRLSIVVKSSAIGNLKLDNVAIPSISFTPVSSNSAYSFTRLTLDTLTLNQHILTCDSGFNATIYGFEVYDFYGHHLGYYRPDLPDVPTAIHKITNNLNLKVFPIPASQNLNVQSERQIRSVTITDLLGRELIAVKPNGVTALEIDLGAISDGVYYCTVSYDNNNEAPELVKFLKIAGE